MNIYGSQWTTVDGNAISIQDITLPSQDCSDYGEIMMVYTPGVGYAIYTYFTDTIKDISLPEENWESMGPGWGDADGQYVDLTLPVGSAYWLNTIAAKTFTVSGAVAKGEGELQTKAATLSLCSLPFPITGNIQDVKLPSSECSDYGETMMVYTPGSGYAIYTYFTDTIKDISLPEENWESMGPGWGDADGQYVDITFPVGSGFWLNTASSKTFTVASPF